MGKMIAPHIQELRKGSSFVYRFQPKQELRAALGVTGFTMYDKSEAEAYSREIVERYDNYRRKMRNEITISERTLDGLVAWFYTVSEFKDKAENTQKSYKDQLALICSVVLPESKTQLGRLQISTLDRSKADKLKQHITEHYSKHRAFMCIKTIRRLFYVAMAYGKPVKFNPFAKMSMKTPPSRKKRWEQDYIYDFIEKADSMGLQGVGTLALACYDIAQRPGDIRQLTWDNYIDGNFVFVQEKTKVAMKLQVSDELKERLANTKRLNSTNRIIYHIDPRSGRACEYDDRNYNKHRQKVLREMGLSESLQFRDLRRTAASEMANAGCTDDEIRDVTGHQTRDVLSIYLDLDGTAAINAQAKRKQKFGRSKS